MKCIQCGLRWEPMGGAGGQQVPSCPLCFVAAERDRLAAQLAKARGALEQIGADECAFVGSYADCFEAMANPYEGETKVPCPKCVATRALASLNTPSPTAPAHASTCATRRDRDCTCFVDVLGDS
jgi:hypothetical protein